MSSPNRSNLPEGAFITTFNGKRFDEYVALDIDNFIDDTVDPSTASAANKRTLRGSSSSSSAAATARGNNITTAAAASIDYQFSEYDELLITTPSCTTPSTASDDPPPPPIQQTQAPPAPVVSNPPLPIIIPSSSSTPPLVDAEPPATIPTFQQIPSIPPQSVPLPAQLPPVSSSSSVPPIIPPIAPGTSQTDANAVPTQPAQTPPALSDVSPPPASSSTPAPAAPTVLNPGTAAGEAGAGAGNGNNAPASSQPSSQGSNRSGGVATPVVIASSVVGAAAVIGLLGFLLWFWRKRWLRKRRSTLLTPLSTDPSFRTGEKFVIDRGSLGPTPRTAKLKAALGYNFNRFRGQVGGLVSRNRDSSSTGGRSQFMNISQHSRNSSSMSNHGGPRDVVTTKDRMKDWWERLRADMKFNWRLRGDKNAEKDPFAASRDMKERKAATGGQPDFLTLLGMDEREVEREAQRRRLSRGKGSAGSGDHFLGGLGLNFDNASANPFSDINALPHDSAKPAPLAVANPSSNNPFSDSNAISAPAAEATNDLCSRRPTIQGYVGWRQHDAATKWFHVLSPAGLDFRSDPFDLERPELLGNRSTPASSNYSQAGGGPPRVPGSAHTRSDSFSSKYSSGVSMDGWSDPGPDVGPSGGPAAYRYEAESPVAGYRPGEQRKPGRRPSQTSQGSQQSVGKAL
uniref:Uncharacterized protein n=1 Tax=Colletotrichum fructicola (strain Nara gc5) TaxID=1213859 RepID=L2GA12_COLFN